jgi:hypothetical protein
VIRIVLKILLVGLILTITHPYAFFSFAFQPLHVTIYWDAPDQDEDIFVSRIDPYDGSAEMVYQEESKRDHDQKSKLKLKFKVVYFISQPDALPFRLYFENKLYAPVFCPLQKLPTDHFHPPDFIS